MLGNNAVMGKMKMSNALADTVGFIAAALTTFSFVPQFLRLARTKKTAGLSLLMMIQIFVGLLLWIVYGFLRDDFVLVIANGVGALIVLLTIILYLSLRKDSGV